MKAAITSPRGSRCPLKKPTPLDDLLMRHSSRLSCSTSRETLGKWSRQAAADRGQRPGVVLVVLLRGHPHRTLPQLRGTWRAVTWLVPLKDQSLHGPAAVRWWLCWYSARRALHIALDRRHEVRTASP